ncbi:MAG: GGDEF domain-containing protein [Hyphococcus sp.]|nr:MAG: GGDEF domain-containing protein [Marinicaulis sp.]
MGQALRSSEDPQTIGQHTLQELGDMSIPPVPPYYEVWFSHLERKNDDLSSEIDSAGASIDEMFLKNIHGKYFENGKTESNIDDYTAQLLLQTKNMKHLIENFDDSAKEFHKDLDDASVQMEAGNIDEQDPKVLLGTLLQTAQKAIERNAELEQNLSLASTKISSLQEAVEMIATDANTDFLTKLHNRRYFDNAFDQLLDSARISNEPLCLVVADIDHFKNFNDTWGHHIGDQVLKLVAGTLRENVKGQDLIARYGGEEFSIALPNTTLEDAVRLTDNIRVAVSKRKLVNKATNSELGRITMSFGIAMLDEKTTAEDIFQQADSALYAAKDAGRNCVRTHPECDA